MKTYMARVIIINLCLHKGLMSHIKNRWNNLILIIKLRSYIRPKAVWQCEGKRGLGENLVKQI